MGVPKFYRWISERYPKINQIITDNALLPEFDHLYLDMNGIIHGCTHPSDLDVSQVLSERDMMMGIMQYLDRIITQIVKPKVSVYMAIDGVAPRAKLNQQRSRRYRSAKDMAEIRESIMEEQNGGAKAKQLFDSNCITPGTEFLQRVSEVIRFFIRKKIKEDPVWKHLTVIFSGHDIPGEGEHKIMEHIRQMRSQPNYQPNTRHCIYGQDADLIMLGLVTHEPHFTILREVIDFSFSRSGENTLKEVKKFTKESDFQLLHLSVLREYFAIEFTKENDGQYDLERCIDDFVFMTFLVGNDFLPHMPALDIGDGAFDMLFSIYKELRSSWGEGNYLTHAGEISDPLRLETFIAAVGSWEGDILWQKKKDEATFIKNKRRWDKRDGRAPGPTDEEMQATEDAKHTDFQTMIGNMLAKYGTDEINYVEGWQPMEHLENDFKGRYYYEKLDLKPVDKELHWKLRKSYMEGLVWCLAYYYRGCISWEWFYPYHYGPMLSDLIGISKIFESISFQMGQPLPPFQQLMACLPPGSAELVPRLYRWLMTSPESPIIQFYPEGFVVDMNGKKNPWEGVNLLPFIDVQLLRDTIEKHCPPSKLTPEERKRNSFGKVYAYQYDSSCIDTVLSPNRNIGLTDLTESFSRATVVEEPSVRSPAFQPKLIPGTRLPFPGFPSLNVLPFTSIDFVSIGLNCFGTKSKYPTCVLTMAQMPELPALPVLAKTVLGKSLYVNWPMMHEGKVVAISDREQEIRLVKGQPKPKPHSDGIAERWLTETEDMQLMYYVGDGAPGSGGVNVGEIKVRLKLLPLQGMKVNPSNGATKKIFGREEADVPLQLALWAAPAPDPRFKERGPLTLNERFPVGSSVVLTKGKYRGCVGETVGIVDSKTVAVKVQTIPAEVPFGLAIARTVQESYLSSNDVARILKIQPGVLGKIAGKLNFEQGRYDLGLNLKSANGMCVAGYTRKKVETPKSKPNNNGNSDKVPNSWAAGDTVKVVGSKRDEVGVEDRIVWEYTPKAVRLIESYRSKFPQLFVGIANFPNEKKYDANAIFGPNGESWLPVIRDWLNSLESAKLPRSPVTTQSMSYEAVAAVQRASDVRCLAMKKKGFPKESVIKIPGGALYREGSTGATNVLFASDLNNGDSPQLGDRIVNLAADGIPFGLRGTVVGIHEAATTGCVEVVMDEEFIGGTTLQGLCLKFRGKLCPWSRLLKVSPEDAKGQVDKLVPKGSGKEAVDKIIQSIDPSAKQTSKRPAATNSNQSNAPVAAAPKAKKPTPADQKANSKPPPAATRDSSSGRAVSSQKFRQGGWREARGPIEKDLGFKENSTRKGNNGVAMWKSVVSANQKNAAEILKAKLGITSSPVCAEVMGSASDQLKAVLGVNGPEQSGQTSDAVSDLKSLLGVQSFPDKTEDSMFDTSAADSQLKAALGVGSQTPTTPIMVQSPPKPVSAADKLFEMMASSQPMHPHMVGPASFPYFSGGAGSHPGFNFSYVEEGSVAPVLIPPPNVPPSHGVPGPYYSAVYAAPPQYPPHPNMFASHGFPPTPHPRPQETYRQSS